MIKEIVQYKEVESEKNICVYHIIIQVGEVAYRLAFPLPQFKLHDMSRVSQLRKFVSNSYKPILLYMLEVADDLSFQPRPSHVFD